MGKKPFGLKRGRFGLLWCMAVLLSAMFLAKALLAEQDQVDKPSKAEVVEHIKKLQIPFIANKGQTDEKVKFYANTFGGTVFVTNDGEIVYSLPNNSAESGVQSLESDGKRQVGSGLPRPYRSQNAKGGRKNAEVRIPKCSGELHSPSRISPLKRGDQGVCNTTPISNDRNETHPRPLLLEGRSGVALKEEFVGAKIKTIQGEEKSVTKVNYFKGKDASKWKTNISTYEMVSLGEVYNGIELKLKAYGNNVEKLFCVKSGANPEQIKIRLSGIQPSENPPPLSPSVRGTGGCPPLAGARGLWINEHGELVAETELGPVKFTKLVAYQEINGRRVDVECKYTIADCGMQNAECKTNPKSETQNPKQKADKSNPQSAIRNPKSEYGFTVASYDKTKDLIIDPLLASTYLGGSYYGYGYSLTLDTSGNVYVMGDTTSTDFPTTSGAYDTSYNGGNYYGDVFVSKLDGGLTSLLTSTYLGGSGDDSGGSLTLDTNGSVYVTGYTSSSDFPTTSGAYDTSFNGGDTDVFVSKLDGNLSASPPTVTTGNATNVSLTSATLDGAVNANGLSTTAWFEYGNTSGSYNNTSSTQSVSGTNATTVSINISGLSPETSYYYRIVAQSSSGTSYGSEKSFKTSVDTTKSPVVTTGSATNVTSNVATLNGTVNANGLETYAWFDYSTTSGTYSNVSSIQSVSGSSNTTVSISISGLKEATTYYYRIVAQNNSGTTYGSEKSFTTSDTSAPTGSISINGDATYTKSISVTLTLSATDNAGVTGYYISNSSTKPSVSASGWTSVTSTTSCSANVSYTLNSGDGSKTMYVWYKDNSGNVSNSASNSIILDTTAPTITITSPTSDDNYTVMSSVIAIGGTASDSTSGVSSVTWSNDKGGSGTASGTTGWLTSSVSLLSGENIITVTATDGAGNTGIDTITVTYNTGTVSTPTPTPSSSPTPLLTPTTEPGKKGIISGHVIDKKGNPIESAKLRLKGTNSKVFRKTISDEDGLFEFTDLVADTYTITALKKGYKTVKQTITLEAGEEKDIEIVMKKTKRK